MKLNTLVRNGLLATALFIGSQAWADGIEGRWKTIDDETGRPKAIVEISQTGNTYSGTIVQLLGNIENRCPACKDNRPLIGLTVLRGLKADGENQYSGGSIFDPKSGKTYRAKAELTQNGTRLRVRGYVGVSLLGRTQTWQRAQ